MRSPFYLLSCGVIDNRGGKVFTGSSLLPCSKGDGTWHPLQEFTAQNLHHFDVNYMNTAKLLHWVCSPIYLQNHFRSHFQRSCSWTKCDLVTHPNKRHTEIHLAQPEACVWNSFLLQSVIRRECLNLFSYWYLFSLTLSWSQRPLQAQKAMLSRRGMIVQKILREKTGPTPNAISLISGSARR